MNRKNTIVVIILVILIIIASILGIVLYNKEHGVENTKNEIEELIEEEVSIEDFKNKLIESGIEIESETENTECDLIGASEGMSYMIEDNLIQVYKFDSSSSDELTVSNLKKAQEEGKVVMPSFNNYEFKVLYNKGLILINSEDNPLKDEIEEIFNNL